MSKILGPPDAVMRVIAPTSTLKVAKRMLSASRAVAAAMPAGFYAPTALDILLVLYVAEDDAGYVRLDEIDLPAGPSAMVVQRWVAALVAQELVDQRGELVALSRHGHGAVTAMIESVHAAQRALD